MKRLSIFAFLLIFSASSFAQPNNGPQLKRAFERIQSEKVAFFTNELDLTPEEAQKFWPVYNQFSKEDRECHDKTVAAFANLNGKDGEKLSDKEIENRLNEYIKALEEEQSVTRKYYNKFKAVLPVQKVAKMYRTEEAFRMRMINHFFPPVQNQTPQNNNWWQQNRNQQQKSTDK